MLLLGRVNPVILSISLVLAPLVKSKSSLNVFFISNSKATENCLLIKYLKPIPNGMLINNFLFLPRELFLSNVFFNNVDPSPINRYGVKFSLLISSK